MPNPSTPSSPEHDAIVAMIRLAHATNQPRRVEILFDALAAVDGARYAVVLRGEHPATHLDVIDRWAPTREGRNRSTWQLFPPIEGSPTARQRAQAYADQHNAVNVAARAQELQDELDGTDR